ncbi:MAG: D-alanyl-D-alanine carboxypeptidase [Clostridia bacterium]|nr:D-alanyl-D-alanine carboxypeptidase [Clostridia bacterium]
MKNSEKFRRLKRILVFTVAIAILASVSTSFFGVRAAPSLSAESAVLMDFDSGAVLLDSNANERMGMASTTKIMTALTVVRLADVSTVISVPREAVGTEGSSVYLCEGEKLTVEQLLYALLLSSANDAAVALAVGISGSIEKFAQEMNSIAAELGLENTNFINPHGLFDEEHYTTAYELAIISREALKDGTLRKIFCTYKAEIPLNQEPDKRLLVNHNKLLKSYDGAIGMKTGFTKKTGRCLVSAAERDGLTLICVTLNAPDDWRDHTAMLDFGFENYERRVFFDVGEFEYFMSVVGGTENGVALTNTQPLALTVKRGDTHAKCLVSSSYRFLFAPLKKDLICATVTVSVGEDSVCSPLAVSEEICAPPKKSFWEKIFDIF